MDIVLDYPVWGLAGLGLSDVKVVLRFLDCSAGLGLVSVYGATEKWRPDKLFTLKEILLNGTPTTHNFSVTQGISNYKKSLKHGLRQLCRSFY